MALLNYMRGVYQAWIDYPLREGKRLAGKYRIERLLGAGSYGLTYLCRDLSSGREVAVKHRKPSKGKLGIELLQREAFILGELHHPDIPQLIEAFEHKKQLYLVTEYVQGHTVEELLFEQGAVYIEKEALRFIRRLAATAGSIHDQGYVHLDIRLPNVIVQEDRLRLIDFGLAARLGEPARLEPDAEEEAIRRRTTEPASDLYAIGHFLLFLLYSGYAPSSVNLNTGEGEYVNSPPGWEEELAISGETSCIIRKLLQLDPPYRESAALLQDLDKALGSCE